VAVVGVLPCQEPYAGHKIRPTGEAQVAVVNNTEDWVPVDWAIDVANPVPTRIEVSHFGETVNTENGLTLQCYVGDDLSCVQVSGGEPNANVVLFCATDRGWTELPFGIFLLSPESVPVPGAFDDRGVFDMPVDLARHELCGCTYHFQALEIVEPRLRDNRYNPFGHERETRTFWERKLALSEGLTIRYEHGNPQPELGHFKPPLTATLVKDVGIYIPTMYNLLVSFEAADSYRLFVDNVTNLPGKTEIYVRLKSPGGPSGDVVTHRKVVDLGPFPEPVVEVWVAMDHSKAVDQTILRLGESEHVAQTMSEDISKEGCRCYNLGAVVQTVF
jgi:hypothetical protein